MSMIAVRVSFLTQKTEAESKLLLFPKAYTHRVSPHTSLHVNGHGEIGLRLRETVDLENVSAIAAGETAGA